LSYGAKQMIADEYRMKAGASYTHPCVYRPPSSNRVGILVTFTLRSAKNKRQVIGRILNKDAHLALRMTVKLFHSPLQFVKLVFIVYPQPTRLSAFLFILCLHG